MANNPNTNHQMKHIDIKWHWIREKVENKDIGVYKIEGTQNPADLLTKNLVPVKVVEHQYTLGLDNWNLEENNQEVTNADS